MVEFDVSEKELLWEDIQHDNAVLFLGANYQSVFYGEPIFFREINRMLCQKKVNELSYKSLWGFMCENSSNKIEGGKKALDAEQCQKMIEICANLPQSKMLSDTIRIGWSSIVTSSIDTGIIRSEGVVCQPIFNVNKRPAGLANKKKLHISYICGCLEEKGSYPITSRISASERANARKMYDRVIKEAIPYSGALVIDGWMPEEDWIKEDIILGTGELDSAMPYPKVYIFSCSRDTISRIFDSELTLEMAESDKLVVSEKSFYECMEEYIKAHINELEEMQNSIDSYETISFQKNKRTVSVNVPKEALRELDTEKVHLMLPRDRMPVSFDETGLRDLTLRFLANTKDSFPYWQGYLQGCYFDREVYANKQKTGLLDRTEAVLQAHNLHNTKNTIILHGTSNSGKSVLLGKLAIELSRHYPVLYINGELATDDPDITKLRYQTLVTFINTYLARNPQIGKTRVAVIWDGGVFVDKLYNYFVLSKELSESNAVLIGSAYELRDSGKEQISDLVHPKNQVEYIQISPRLSQRELESLYNMLSEKLDISFKEALKYAKASAEKKDSSYLIYADNRLLSLLQRTCRLMGSNGNKALEEVQNRTKREQAGNDKFMRDFLKSEIVKAAKHYSIDIKGLSEILKSLTKPAQRDEEWYKSLEKCAPFLNDLLAMAGQFGIRIPLNLIKDIICDIYIDIRPYMNLVDDLLAIDTMLEYPFLRDDVGHEMIGYRSAEEACIYLESHYMHRGNVDTSITVDNEGRPFLEDREIYLLEKVIEHSNLHDYSEMNWNIVTMVRELLDQFGSNSRMGAEFARKYEYKYDELATFILEHGGSENPEMALSAASLKREKIRDSMLKKISKGNNVTSKEKQILDDAADALESAIKIEKEYGQDQTQRMMRLFVEWCTNRNYTFNRENPSIRDVELFKKIHDRFSKALQIYLKQELHRMRPMSMLDVYLNAFSSYVDTMEKLYQVVSKPEEADVNKFRDFVDEVSYAITCVLSRLIDFDAMVDSKPNLNSNILMVYKLSGKSVDTLQKRTRAKGSAAYIVLRARLMWLLDEVDFENISCLDLRKLDYYAISDYADKPGTIAPSVIQAAKRVYEYLSKKENLDVLLSTNGNSEKEIAGLEMLIRAAWISKTGNVPFTQNQFPVLDKSDWDELHKYCKAYTESGNARARYAFAYYLEGIYYWIFTPDNWNVTSHNTASGLKFEYCCRSAILPHGVYTSDSYIYLCGLNTGVPIKFSARIKKQSEQRDLADITSILNPTQAEGMPYIAGRQNIFCAQSLQRNVQNMKFQSRNITIRFNLKGALAGPENPDMEASAYGKR